MKKIKYILFFAVFIILSCSKDKDDNLIELSDNLEISDFIWKGLNDFYYWQSDVPNLADSMVENQNTYSQFIYNNSEPESFFELLLYSNDKFSWIVSDYVALENSLQGIVASNGLELGLTRQCSGCNDLVAYVKYVHPESDASLKNILRGDLFTVVNGFNLTMDNYKDLLFNDNLMTYTISLSNYESGSFTPIGQNITLTKKENFEKNPIYVNEIVAAGSLTGAVTGTYKIGYLMYNQFVSSYEDELNDVFAEFRSENITELVLDLRYNRGGSINNCIVLSSLITGQFNGKVFSKQNWNSKLNKYWEDKNEDLNDYFVGSLSNGMSLNSLNLQKLYVLTSSESASASELLINGLTSHIQVIQIGDTTVGKNVGSITIYDYLDNDGNKNPNHKYAMQPIVLAIENSEGFSDYTEGLKPDHESKESVSQLGILGNPQETLFSKAIELINGFDIISRSSRSDKLIENRVLDPEMLREQKLIIEIPNFRILENN
tara:strand:- start:5504 stop:6973 length:1470 start_codon:yes stop_codon:yes gene_type:complete